MKVKVSIFADETYGCFYGISKFDEETREWEEFEHVKFINQQIESGYVKDAKDIRSRIEEMTSDLGLIDKHFRDEGSAERKYLEAIPGKNSKGRLRLYAYRYSDKFGLLGGGCYKPHKGYSKRKLNDFDECKDSADLLAAVHLKLREKANRRVNTIEFRDDGIYSGASFEEEIILEL